MPSLIFVEAINRGCAGEDKATAMKLLICHNLPPAHASLLVEHAKKGHVPTIAVDFDGTIAKHVKHPKIGKLIKKMRKRMRRYKDAGYRVIIWTCRGDRSLIEKWLTDHDVPFDDINHNSDQPADTSNKIVADVYIDDRAVNPEDDDVDGQVDKIVKRSMAK
jgi:hypothetical protein